MNTFRNSFFLLFCYLYNFLTHIDEEEAKKDPRYNLKMINSEAQSTLEELKREYTPSPYLVCQFSTCCFHKIYKVVVHNIRIIIPCLDIQEHIYTFNNPQNTENQ